MAVIAIVCDIEEGHLFPSFGLAKMLQNAGHEIVYLVIKDLESYVCSAGFSIQTIFPDIYPAGTNKRHHELLQAGDKKQVMPHIIPLLEGSLDEVLLKVRPDLLLTSYFLALEALIIHFRYSFKQVLFCPYLREELHTPAEECLEAFMNLEGEVSSQVLNFIMSRFESSNVGSLYDLLIPLNNIPELIPCPKEFDFPEKKFLDQNVFHIGPCIYKPSRNYEFNSIPNHKKIIYASFGSQSVLFIQEHFNLIKSLILVMSRKFFEEYHLVVSVGSFLSKERFENIPSNVSMVNWAPQIELIERSSLVITHGGLGSIKECLFSGVPMLVFPMVRDQPENALRVELHNVGKNLDLKSVTIDIFEETMIHILQSQEILTSTQNMQKLFHKKEQLNQGCLIINDLLQDVLSKDTN